MDRRFGFTNQKFDPTNQIVLSDNERGKFDSYGLNSNFGVKIELQRRLKFFELAYFNAEEPSPLLLLDLDKINENILTHLQNLVTIELGSFDSNTSEYEK